MIEPLCVFGASEYKDQYHAYLGGLLRLQGILLLVLFALLSLAGLLCRLAPPLHLISGTLLGLAVACPFQLLFATLRAATYLKHSPVIAVRSSALYCVVLLVSLSWTKTHVGLSAGSALLITGLASAAASIGLTFSLKPVLSGSGFRLSQLAKEHWHFGRWEVAKIGADWLCENISLMAAGAVLGIAEVGTLKALTTLFMPFQQIITALRRMFIPKLSTMFKLQGHDATRERIKHLALGYSAGAAIYCAVLSVGARWLVPALYGNKFPGIISLVPWLGLMITVAASVYALDMGLRAVRFPKAIFISSSWTALSQIILIWPLSWLFGLRGLIAANIVSTAVFAGTMAWSLRNHRDSSLVPTVT